MVRHPSYLSATFALKGLFHDLSKENDPKTFWIHLIVLIVCLSIHFRTKQRCISQENHKFKTSRLAPLKIMNGFNLVLSAFAVKPTKTGAFSYPVDCKGAKKLYFMHYSHVVIVCSVRVYINLHFLTILLSKTRLLSLCVLIFRVSVCLVFSL